MPPRIRSSVCQVHCPRSSPSTTNSIASFLLPFFHQQHVQTRSASILSSLSDTPGAYNKPIRRGRGPSSGKGKTSGRGHKGQKQHGKVPKGFQGGQTPEEIVHGKMGFKNVHHVEMSPVNLSRIADWIQQKRLDPSKPITLKELTTSRAIHGIKDGIKLLADGASSLTVPINIVVSRASKSAIAAVEAAGGTVTTRYYTPQSISRIRQNVMHPFISLRWDPISINRPALLNATDNAGLSPEERVTGLGYEYRLPDPASRKDIEYYRDEKNRGYLAHTVKEGESASLYFRPPPTEEQIKAAKIAKGRRGGLARAREANQLW